MPAWTYFFPGNCNFIGPWHACGCIDKCGLFPNGYTAAGPCHIGACQCCPASSFQEFFGCFGETCTCGHFCGGPALPKGAPGCCGCKYCCLHCGYFDLTPIKKAAATKHLVIAAPSMASFFMLAANYVEDHKSYQILFAISLMMMLFSAILIVTKIHLKKAAAIGDAGSSGDLKEPLVVAERGEAGTEVSVAPTQEDGMTAA